MTPDNLEYLPDAELAKWQAGWKSGTDMHILAEKEWARRLAARQLKEQFRLEEQLAKANRWWGIGAASIGVVGTLAGAWLGAHWQSTRAEIPAVTPTSVTPSPRGGTATTGVAPQSSAASSQPGAVK